MTSTSCTEWPCSEVGYDLDWPIGRGAFGLVWKATVKEGQHQGEEVAIKIINLESHSTENSEEIRKEISIMNQSDHPNIISYYKSFCVQSEVWLVMQLMRASSI